MTYRSDICGFDPSVLISSEEIVTRRLEAILGDKVLRFNPYSVDDTTLLACVERAVWRPWPALTQMVALHFHDIRRVQWTRPYDAIFFHVGNDSTERHFSIKSMISWLTYTADMHQVHVEVNGHSLTNGRMIEQMQHKDYFISHALPCRTEDGQNRMAYRMYRLRGDDRRRAELVRRRMLESKIAMLEEILAHPYTPAYLRCSRNFIDYTKPILAAIESIHRFPEQCKKI